MLGWFLYGFVRGLMLGCWMFMAIALGTLNDIQNAPGARDLPHVSKLLDGILIGIVGAAICAAWTPLGWIHFTKDRYHAVFTLCTLFDLTLLAVFIWSLSIQSPALPRPLGTCKNADKSELFTTLARELTETCYYEAASYVRVCRAIQNTPGAECYYYGQAWRLTLAAIVLQSMQLLEGVVWRLFTWRESVTGTIRSRV